MPKERLLRRSSDDYDAIDCRIKDKISRDIWTSFDRWVRKARRGQVAVYHVGNLISDRGFDGVYMRKRIRRNEVQRRVDDYARAAWRLYLSGQVVLVQKRMGPGVCEYRMVRR